MAIERRILLGDITIVEPQPTTVVKDGYRFDVGNETLVIRNKDREPKAIIKRGERYQIVFHPGSEFNEDGTRKRTGEPLAAFTHETTVTEFEVAETEYNGEMHRDVKIHTKEANNGRVDTYGPDLFLDQNMHLYAKKTDF